MKLQELAVANPIKQAAKVFESYFGKRVDFNTVSQGQARNMLKRVRNLIAEHRRTPEFHSSERNPAYLKLVMMEQALAATATAPVGGVAPGANPAATAGMQAAQIQQKRKQLQDQLKAAQQQVVEIQKQIANPTMAMAETRRNLRQRLRESEIQQAQVVLAAQDMVDQVQKMSEQISAMQFKDLPALVDQIKNEVGVDQATQFNGDASAALSGLLQNLGGAKQQLEASLGVVTGQAPQVPGDETGLGAPVPGQEEIGIDAELPTPDGEEDIDAEMDANVAPTGLGRDRR
jgi:hypothetical protein